MSNRDAFLSLAASTGKSVMTRAEIGSLCDENGISFPQWFTKNPVNRAGRNLYNIPGVNTPIVENVVPMKKETVTTGNRIASVTTELETENQIGRAHV